MKEYKQLPSRSPCRIGEQNGSSERPMMKPINRNGQFQIQRSQADISERLSMKEAAFNHPTDFIPIRRLCMWTCETCQLCFLTALPCERQASGETWEPRGTASFCWKWILDANILWSDEFLFQIRRYVSRTMIGPGLVIVLWFGIVRSVGFCVHFALLWLPPIIWPNQLFVHWFPVIRFHSSGSIPVKSGEAQI